MRKHPAPGDLATHAGGRGSRRRLHGHFLLALFDTRGQIGEL